MFVKNDFLEKIWVVSFKKLTIKNKLCFMSVDKMDLMMELMKK